MSTTEKGKRHQGKWLGISGKIRGETSSVSGLWGLERCKGPTGDGTKMMEIRF